LEETMAFSFEKLNLKGCLFGPPSPKDYRTVFGDSVVPEKVDLREYCTRVEDQGQLGSCTANATVGALEYLYKKRDGQSPDLSRLFVYFNARRIRGTTAMDSGALICDAMASVLSFGACREEIWPYNIQTFFIEPSPDAYQEALMHEAIQYSRVDGIQGCMGALAAGFPVVFGTRIPMRCYKEAAETGFIPIPSPEDLNSGQIGGHCMLIVGYDKPKKMFIVRNSWGEGWGDRGYCRIPFEVIEKCSPPDTFWIIGELAKPGNFTVARPGRSAVQPAAAPGPSKTISASEKATKMRQEIRESIDAEIEASNRRIEKLFSGTTGGKKPPRDPIPCPMCGGTGQGIDGGTCTKCGGVGFVESFDAPKPGSAANARSADSTKFREKATCPTCAGSGNCQDCYGTGTNCNRCGGTGKCGVCEGTGIVGK
jgi:hypothetical protein